MRKKKDMRIGIIIIVVSIIVLGTIGYSLYQSILLGKLQSEILVVGKANTLSLLVGVENFHTQLEIREYVYDSSEVRLDAFLFHEENLNDDIENLIVLIGSYAQLFDDGTSEEIYSLSDDLEIIESDWESVIRAVKEYETARENNVSDDELDVMSDKIYDKVVESEDLFDSYDFNNRLDDFAEKQGDKIQEYLDKLIDVQKNIQSSLFILVVQYLVLLVFIAIWLSKIIKRNK